MTDEIKINRLINYYQALNIFTKISLVFGGYF